MSSTPPETGFAASTNNPICSIPDSLFKKLLVDYVTKGSGSGIHRTLQQCQAVSRYTGSSNFIITLSLSGMGKYIIKVPLQGLDDDWHSGWSWNFTRKIEAMDYIARHISYYLVPTVYSFDDGCDNIIGAPYVIMEALEGKTALDYCFDEDVDDTDLYERKKTFLRSLAEALWHLQQASFDRTGMLRYEQRSADGGIGTPEVTHWYFFDRTEECAIEEQPVHSSSEDFWKWQMEHSPTIRALEAKIAGKDGDGDEADIARGTLELYKHILESPAFMSSRWYVDEEESFVLTNMYLDWSNIFVNDEGKIVGISDWHYVQIQPRCLGAWCPPPLLSEDRAPGYDVETALLDPWELEHFRKLYTEYLLETDARENGRDSWTEMGIEDLERGRISRSTLCGAVFSALQAEEYSEWLIKWMFKDSKWLKPYEPNDLLRTLGCHDGSKAGCTAETMCKYALHELLIMITRVSSRKANTPGMARISKWRS